MTPLPPALDRVLPRRMPQFPQQAPHRVPQQVDIGRVVHVRLDHNESHRPRNCSPRLFLATAWPLSTTSRPISDRSSGVIKYTLSMIVLQLVAVALRKRTVAQELADRAMLVHKLLETVKVTTKTLLQNTHYQNPPQLHPRTPHFAIRPRQYLLLQQRKQLLRVSSCEYRCWRPSRTAGMSSRRQLDVLDSYFTQCELRFPCLSHCSPSSQDCRLWVDYASNSCMNYLIWTFFRNLEPPFIL